MHRLPSPSAERESTKRPSARAVAIIPARLGSTRLPEKALQDLGGAPLVVRVLQRARQSQALADIYVATDEERVASVVGEAGAKAILTNRDHLSGTDRVAEAARLISDSMQDSDTIILNVQGDEPFLNPAGLDHLVRLFERPEVAMATLAAPFAPADDPRDENRVKVVVDRAGRALYFSRAPIPHGFGSGAPPLLHVGIYAYRQATLRQLAALPPCPLEQAERLEQLRALWHGIDIHVAVGDYHSIGIDTPEDLARARTHWEEGRIVR